MTCVCVIVNSNGNSNVCEFVAMVAANELKVLLICNNNETKFNETNDIGNVNGNIQYLMIITW